MPGGNWNSSLLPVRSGTFANFIAAVQAALTPGTTGSVAIVGEADWGPANVVESCNSQAAVDGFYGGLTWGGDLRDAALQTLDGFDDGGAQFALTYRAVDSTGTEAVLTLNDASGVAALVLTAFYPGIRANNWSVIVQTNASNSSNKDILLYESGVQIAAFMNITGGTNTAAAAEVTAVTALPTVSDFVTATSTGTTGRALANIVGVVGGAGGFTGGNSGSTLTLADYTAAFTALQGFWFDAVALANVTDLPTQDAFAAWGIAYNQTSGHRTFVVIGGAQGESSTAAVARSFAAGSPSTGNFNNPDVINAGVTDLVNQSTGAVLSTAYLAPRIAGSVSAAGLGRATTGMTWTGYSINSSTNTPSDAGYQNLVLNGVFCFRADDPTTVSVEEGITSQVTYNSTFDVNKNITNPQAHQQIANVAIDHFIANTLQVLGNAARGSLRNAGAGQTNFVGNVVAFLNALSKQNVIEGGATAAIDNRYNNTGNALFLTIGITYVEFVNQFLFTVTVAG
jgi:hypothetical protein